MSILLSLFCAAGPALGAGPAVALDRRPDLVVDAGISVPTAAEDAPEEVSISSPWRLVYTGGGVRTWETELPIRPRTLFFHRAPGDMEVLQGEKPLRISAGSAGPAQKNTWAYSTHSLQVRRPIAAGPPSPGEYTVRYSSATKQEDGLRYRDGEDPESFVFQALQLNDTTRSGLLLPAPGEITFSVTIPEGGAVLDLTPALLPPELADPADKSDGARLTVLVDGESVTEWRLDEGVSPRKRVRLSDWGGQEVSLTLRSTPGPSGDATWDYVFAADPVIFVPSPDPERIVVLFLDTLRADHLSTYGYPRETTPRLDRWAEQGTVFEQARSIAPWTLPSARTMMIGQHPEGWSSGQTVQGVLSEEGWATTFIAGNIYLSSNFEMARDFSEHRCINWPIAQVQVDRALDYLSENSDRPVFMMLHFMDMHLPYTEPPWYRYKFAGAAPAALPDYGFHRSEVVKAARSMGAEGKQYVRDRYDNNLRYLDDQIARVLRQLGENDTVILVSDHGEEFWDHGDFEHGHSLYDELLRVPMIARGPGFTPGRVDAPTSLIDLAPSIAQAAGVALPGAVGMPLQPLSAGETTEKFTQRPQAFGRPLYGERRWGSLHQGIKYSSHKGNEDVYDLNVDPGERDDLAPEGMVAGREALGAALGSEAPIVFRLIVSLSKGEKQDVIGRLTVPGGIRRAWIGEDYLNRSASEITVIDDDTVEILWDASQRTTREVYVLPALPSEEAVADAELVMRLGDEEIPAEQAIRAWPPQFAARNPPLLRAAKGRTRLSLGFAVAPVPEEDTSRDGLDACENLGLDIAEKSAFVERCLELVALGYMDEEGCAEKARELDALQAQHRRECR